jgi:hypothetical protein
MACRPRADSLTPAAAMRAVAHLALVMTLPALLAVAAASDVGAAGASPEPGAAARGSCSERYPADGPAGLDLRLGCIAAELVGNYTGAGAPAEPARISSWLLPLVTIVGSFVLVFLPLRLLSRRVGRRLAPAAPTAWWTCPRCRSLNAAGSGRCYACGQPWSSDALAIPAAAVDGAARPRGSGGSPPS